MSATNLETLRLLEGITRRLDNIDTILNKTILRIVTLERNLNRVPAPIKQKLIFHSHAYSLMDHSHPAGDVSDLIEDDVFGAGWNGDTTHAASQNALYDKIVTIDEDHATPIATHAAITTSHHTKYTNAEAVSANFAVLKLHPVSSYPGDGALQHTSISSSASFLGGDALIASDADNRMTYFFVLPTGFSESVTVHIIWSGNTDNNITYEGKTGYDNYDVGDAISTSEPPNSANMDFVNDTTDWKLFENTRALTSISKELLFIHVGSRASNASYIVIKSVYIVET